MLEKILRVIARYSVHLCNPTGEVDALKLFHDHFDFIFAVVPNFFDLCFLSLAPISAFASLVLLKIIVKFTQQVLVGTLTEDYLKLRYAIFVRSLFTLRQEIEDLFFAHTEATLQNRKQVFVVDFNLLDIIIFQFCGQAILHAVKSVVNNLFDLIFMGFASSS